MFETVSSFIAGHSTVNVVKIFPTSGQLIGTGGKDRTVKIWALENSEDCLLTLEPHSSPVTQISFDRMEEVCVSGCKSGQLKLWDLEYQKESQHRLSKSSFAISQLEFHPISEFFSTANEQGEVSIWDTRHRKPVQSYSHRNNSSICGIKFSPDGQWIVSGDTNGSIKIWDLIAGKILKEFFVDDCNDSVNSFAFHSFDLFLVSVYSSGLLKLINLETWDEKSMKANVNSAYHVQFDSDSYSGWMLHDEGLDRFDWDSMRTEEFIKSSPNSSDTKNVLFRNDLLMLASSNNDIVTIAQLDLSQGNTKTRENSWPQAKELSHSIEIYKSKLKSQENLKTSEDSIVEKTDLISLNSEEALKSTESLLSECINEHYEFSEQMNTHMNDLKTIQVFWNQQSNIALILKLINEKEAYSCFRDILPLLKRNSSLWITLENSSITIQLIAKMLSKYPKQNHKEGLELISKLVTTFSKIIIETIELQKDGRLGVSLEDRLTKSLEAARSLDVIDKILTDYMSNHPKERYNLVKLQSAIHGITLNTLK